MPSRTIPLEDNPLWYKDAILYEVHVKTFCDSDGDGIGDFKGLSRKLDYLADLGVTALWLLPFYPSPLRDDGYDIADYYRIHPRYGSLRDFKDFIRSAHRRGIRVITELVLNHTSDQNEWFRKSRQARPGSRLRDFYVWSDTPEKYKDARIIFKDFETSNWSWDPVARAYYWHRFYSHQPDLNYDSPHVYKALLKVMDHWFGMGVDGMRLDAVPYLYQRENTNCENLPETYELLKKLRAHIDASFSDKMLLAEANQWPEDAAAYLGEGDLCHMAFHFPLMPRIFMALHMEDRYPIGDILEQTPRIPDLCQWAIFLRNHDELTLEMVTDEERDYMYRIYARDPRARINLGIRRRLAPLLGNDRRKMELMNVLLFTLPGTPVIYYGDEIGMGDNYYLGDRDGVRTPMQWSADRNGGFSRANPQKLYLPVIIDPLYHFEAVNVENQERNPSSLLWWMRNAIGIRKQFKAFGRGSIRFLYPENSHVLAFVRSHEDENILVVVNLSRHPQLAELDLSAYAGHVPREIYSRSQFIPVKESLYPVTLGPYGYYLFLLQKEEEPVALREEELSLDVDDGARWEAIFSGEPFKRLQERVLPAYARSARWFGGKARRIRRMSVVERIPVGRGATRTQMLFIRVQYVEGDPETYMLPLALAEGEEALRLRDEVPQAVAARVSFRSTVGVLYDAIYDKNFCDDVLAMISRKIKFKGVQGEVVGLAGKGFKRIRKGKVLHLAPHVLKAEQTNTSVAYGNELYLKMYRRPSEGVNPDVELVRFLTEKVPFAHIPPFAGALEYRARDGGPVTLGILQDLLPNQGDGWTYMLRGLEHYFERVSVPRNGMDQGIPELPSSLLDMAGEELPRLAADLITPAPLEMVGLLGTRTAQLHLALASDPVHPDFAPEPFSLLYQRSVYQSMQTLTKQVFQLLEKSLEGLPEEVREEAARLLEARPRVLSRFWDIRARKIEAVKIRIHGDYHLGQVLYTGKDFILIDFEGEPMRPLSERRLKRSPMRDVAGMIRSFHYASRTGFHKEVSVRARDPEAVEPWADLWYRCMAGTFLKAYLETAGKAPFIPEDSNALRVMLTVYLLEKAVYELGYELNNRPQWLHVPLRGIGELLESEQ